MLIIFSLLCSLPNCRWCLHRLLRAVRICQPDARQARLHRPLHPRPACYRRRRVRPQKSVFCRGAAKGARRLHARPQGGICAVRCLLRHRAHRDAFCTVGKAGDACQGAKGRRRGEASREDFVRKAVMDAVNIIYPLPGPKVFSEATPASHLADAIR